MSCSGSYAHIFTFPLRVFKWTFTFEMWFIPSWTNLFKPHPHTRLLSRLTSSPPNNVTCLLTFAWSWTRIAMPLSAEIWRSGYSKPYVLSDLIQNIWKTSQVRWKLKIDTWLIIWNVNLSNKFNFWNVNGNMNTSCLLQSYFARDPKYSWFHEHSKNWIHFLNVKVSFLLTMKVGKVISIPPYNKSLFIGMT